MATSISQRENVERALFGQETDPPKELSMQVLVLGMCRTGTQSIADALEKLGYRGVYHMREVFVNKDHDYWIAGLEAKFEGKGERYGREKFDEALEKYEALADIPAAIFAEELISAYPDASVVLTVRDAEKWKRSVEETIWQNWMDHQRADTITPGRRLASAWVRYLWNNDFLKNGIEQFEKHNELVKQKTPPERLLVFEVSQGWKPLCKFLGKEVPSEAFPWSDDWSKYKEERSAKHKVP